MFQRARAASAEALRWEQVGPVRGRARRPGWLQLRESARRSGWEREPGRLCRGQVFAGMQ